MNQVFTLVLQFITSCPPSNPDLGLTPYPALNITFPDITPFPGETATVQIASSSYATATHIAFISGLTPTYVPILNGTVLVPANVSGQVYAVAISSGSYLPDNTVAGPAILLFEKFSNGTLTN